jgi:hypothetical protein
MYYLYENKRIFISTVNGEPSSKGRRFTSSNRMSGKMFSHWDDSFPTGGQEKPK